MSSDTLSRDDVLDDIEAFAAKYDRGTRKAFEINYDHIPALQQHFHSIRTAIVRSDASFSGLHFTDSDLDAIEDVLIEHLRTCKERNGKASQPVLREEDDLVNPGRIKRHFGTYSKGKLAALDNPKQVHITDDQRQKLNKELKNNQYKRDLITGLLMGDGWMKYPEAKTLVSVLKWPSVIF